MNTFTASFVLEGELARLPDGRRVVQACHLESGHYVALRGYLEVDRGFLRAYCQQVGTRQDTLPLWQLLRVIEPSRSHRRRPSRRARGAPSRGARQLPLWPDE